MRIFVTGGTGFLGRHLVWRLAELGNEVGFSGRDAAKARVVVENAAHAVAFVPCSHGAPEAPAALKHATAGFDAVVHCAALSSPWGRPEDFHHANVRSTAEVLSAMQANDIPRLVHISTPSLYFQFRDRLGVRDQPFVEPALLDERDAEVVPTVGKLRVALHRLAQQLAVEFEADLRDLAGLPRA